MAPPGYLWIVKGIISLTGPGELSLRALSMVAGIGLTVVGWWLTRRLFGPWPAAGAAAMLALSPGAIYYSNEVKPYSSDALVAAVLMLAGAWAIDRELTWRGTASLACSARWRSGCPTLRRLPFSRGNGARGSLGAPKELARCRAACGRWQRVDCSWGVVYHLARQGADSGYMQWYWRDQFLHLSLAAPYRSATALMLALDVPAQNFRQPARPMERRGENHRPRPGVAGPGHRRPGTSAKAAGRSACCWPRPLTALMAAVAHLYPLDGRLDLFMQPSFVALASAGVWYLSERGIPRVAALLIAVSLDLVLLCRSPDAAQSLRARGRDRIAYGPGVAGPTRRHRLRVEWRGVSRQFLPPHTSLPLALRCPGDLGTPDSTLTESELARGHLQAIGELCGRPRVWLAVAHLYPLAVHRDVLAILQARGAAVTSSRRFEGAELSQLDLRNLPCGP